jgi:hypothetical protein
VAGLGLELHGVEGEELAGERRLVFGPQGSQNGDGLLQSAAAGGEVHADGLVLLADPT